MEFWLIMIAFIVMGGSCSLAGTWWDRKNKKEKIKKIKKKKRNNKIYTLLLIKQLVLGLTAFFIPRKE